MVVEVLWCAYSPRWGVEDGCCDLNWWLMVAACQSSSRFRKSIVLSSLVLLYCTSPFRIIVADRSCAALCSKKRCTLWIDMLCFSLSLIDSVHASAVHPAIRRCVQVSLLEGFSVCAAAPDRVPPCRWYAPLLSEPSERTKYPLSSPFHSSL
jgi:hypothetical protein